MKTISQLYKSSKGIKNAVKHTNSYTTKANKMVSEEDIEYQAIKKVIERLKNDKLEMVFFLKDMTEGKHKRWSLYRYAYSEVKSQYLKGRAVPIKHSVGGGNPIISTKIARRYDTITKGVFVPQLPLWKCRTKNQRIKMITDSDISPDIKAELIMAQL